MCCTTPSTNEVLIQRHDTPALDASVLLAPLLGLLRSDDERVCKTVPVSRKGSRLIYPGAQTRLSAEETDLELMGGGIALRGWEVNPADTLEHAIWTRRQAGINDLSGLIHHTDPDTPIHLRGVHR